MSLALAGPQVGFLKPVIIYGNLSYARENALLSKVEVLLNPKIIYLSKDFQDSEEVCLSLPEVSAIIIY
jgi:peptide deformylase